MSAMIRAASKHTLTDDEVQELGDLSLEAKRLGSHDSIRMRGGWEVVGSTGRCWHSKENLTAEEKAFIR
jgi:hypothetical protein